MRFTLFLFFGVFANGIFGQLVIENELSASEIINDILLGEGVEAENITINGQSGDFVSSQFGVFDAINSNIGLTRGLILATGGVSVAESPNDFPTAHVVVPENEQLSEEPDLELIMSPAELNDVAVVEFDFTAQGDTLRFKYVFASEEYNEHVCSPYNDAFGFFISGPGIDGGSQFSNNAMNVARIPGTSVPVAINTVNRGTPGAFGNMATCNAVSSNWQANQIYFVNNENNASANATQFDGFTKPFIVEVPLICGETYHIKMAIADASDDKNDSAVFIEAGSFTSTPPLIAAVDIINPDLDGQPLEGCSTYNFTLSRSDSSRSKTVYIRTEGLLNADELIPDLPDSLTFYALDGVKSFEVQILDNAIFEGLRNFNILFLEPEVCSLDTNITTLEMKILDNPNLELTYDSTIALNCFESGNVNIEVSGGAPNYDIVWSDPDYQGFNFVVNPADEIELSATVSDYCGVHQEEVNILVFRQTYSPLVVSVPTEITANCATPVTITPVVTGGYGDYSFEWFQNGVLLSTESALSETITSASAVILIVSDPCTGSVNKSIQIDQQLNPISLELGTDITGQCNNPVTIIPQIEGGFGSFTYIWKVNNVAVSTDQTLIRSFNETSIVTLVIADACGTELSDAINVFISTPQLNIQMPTDTVICENERLVILPKVMGGHEPYAYFWNQTLVENPTYSAIPPGSTSLLFKVEDECGNVAEKTCEVEVKEVLASFSFNYDDYQQPVQNQSTVDIWYDWLFPNGDGSNAYHPNVGFDELKGGSTTLIVRNEIGCEDKTSAIYKPPFRIFLPNAFSPDGDGLNDIFKAEGQFVDSFELLIFDRWGKLVFRTTDFSEGWDGSGADSNFAGQDLVYSYRFIAKDSFGNVTQGTGMVQLLR